MKKEDIEKAREALLKAPVAKNPKFWVVIKGKLRLVNKKGEIEKTYE